MISKTQRISTSQIAWLIRKGAKLSNEFFSVKFQLNKKPNSRYSVVVSKKLLKLATDRNNLRRQLYEIVRNLSGPDQPTDIMISLKPALLPLTFAQKQAQIASLLQQISSKLNTNNG